MFAQFDPGEAATFLIVPKTNEHPTSTTQNGANNG
jgi:hypothetical protein